MAFVIVMEGLKLACTDPELRGHRSGTDQIIYYSRRVMVIPGYKVPGMSMLRESLFSAMHLNANVPAAYFGVRWQVAEVGLEVEV